MENIRNTKKWIIVLVVGVILSFFRLVLFCIPTGFSAFRYFLQMLYSVGEIMTLQQIVLVLFASRSAKYSYIWIGELILIVVFCLLRFFEVGGILWVEIVSLLICFLYYSSEINGIICLTRVFASKKKVESEQRHYDVLHQKEEKAFYELQDVVKKYHDLLVEDGGYKKKDKISKPTVYCDWVNGNKNLKYYKCSYYGITGLLFARNRTNEFEDTVNEICEKLERGCEAVRESIKDYNFQLDTFNSAINTLEEGQKRRELLQERGFNNIESTNNNIETHKKAYHYIAKGTSNKQKDLIKKANKNNKRKWSERIWNKMKS